MSGSHAAPVAGAVARAALGEVMLRVTGSLLGSGPAGFRTRVAVSGDDEGFHPPVMVAAVVCLVEVRVPASPGAA